MNYIINSDPGGLDLPEDSEHRPVDFRVFVTIHRKESWAEVECSCGKTFRQPWDPGMANYRALVYSAWFAGCGRGAYLSPSYDASIRQLWPEEPEPQS